LEELMEKRALAEAQDQPPGSTHSTIHNMPDIKSVTYNDHDDPFSWQHQAITEKNIRALSPLAWVASHGSYILETLGRGSLRIESLLGSGAVILNYLYRYLINLQIRRSRGRSTTLQHGIESPWSQLLGDRYRLLVVPDVLH
jgi:hypothetical protein